MRPRLRFFLSVTCRTCCLCLILFFVSVVSVIIVILSTALLYYFLKRCRSRRRSDVESNALAQIPSQQIEWPASAYLPEVPTAVSRPPSARVIASQERRSPVSRARLVVARRGSSIRRSIPSPTAAQRSGRELIRGPKASPPHQVPAAPGAPAAVQPSPVKQTTLDHGVRRSPVTSRPRLVIGRSASIRRSTRSPAGHPSLPPGRRPRAQAWQRQSVVRATAARVPRLDLHGMKVREALEELDDFLDENMSLGIRRVLIITGRGLHSRDNIPVIRQAVVRRLESEGIRFSYGRKQGCLHIDL
ncbi:uncharacterized protein LOC113209940 [Frankliniella occidentalis]|uniref:Uncharacterized protein LOC113209940 n=1 Tax=Frankliniella occidentalis TaxID=133901 RepID=A0A9C6XQT2_FRAOC|nr:uncharacterized protein LOC113209940 [Frankliniella occidentalis]